MQATYTCERSSFSGRTQTKQLDAAARLLTESLLVDFFLEGDSLRGTHASASSPTLFVRLPESPIQAQTTDDDGMA